MKGLTNDLLIYSLHTQNVAWRNVKWNRNKTCKKCFGQENENFLGEFTPSAALDTLKGSEQPPLHPGVMFIQNQSSGEVL